MADTTIAASTATASTAPTSKLESQGLQIGSETFLTLLLAQLKNQDPMKPMQSTEFVAQLASLSTVEQSAQQTAKLDQVLAVMSLAQAQAVVGHTVTSADGAISGRVTGARVTTDGVVAELDNGRQLLLGPGTTVSGP
jgi:flagellar basal-body rod modification protein FlgD